MHTSGASALSPPHSAPGAGRPAGAGGGVMRELSTYTYHRKERGQGISSPAMYTVNHQRRYFDGHAFVLLKSSKSGQNYTRNGSGDCRSVDWLICNNILRPLTAAHRLKARGCN